MRQFYCEECKTIMQKRECDKFTDKIKGLRKRKAWVKINDGRTILAQLPESHRRDYHKNKVKKID
jgi:hypothetical protein